jgi:hypothetical protein
LDHERREMNEKRETANTGMQQAIPGFDGGYRLRQGGRNYLFSQKNSLCEFFCEKEKKSTMLPQANPASIWSNVQFVDRPRKSCNSTPLTRFSYADNLLIPICCHSHRGH